MPPIAFVKVNKGSKSVKISRNQMSRLKFFEMERSVVALLVWFGFSILCNAQKKDSQWYLEFTMGQNNVVRPFAEKYATNTSGGIAGVMMNHDELGARKMITQHFGWKVDLAYNLVNSSGRALSFKAMSYRLGVEAVFDVGQYVEV